MVISKKELDAFCDRILDLKQQKSDIGKEIKEATEAFAINHELAKKSVGKFIAAYEETLKSKDEFILTDGEADQMLLIAFPEFAPEVV